MTCFLCILFAGAALAQTVAPPPGDKAPAATQSADKAAAAQTPDKTPATPPGADKAAAALSGVGKAPAAAKPAETFQSAMAKQRAAMAIQREAVRKQSEMAV